MTPHIRALAVVVLASCAAPHKPAPPPAAPSTPGLQYVGGTAIRATDPKALAAWYTDRFGLAINGEMPGGFYGGFEWNDTSFNIAIAAAEGEHPGSSPGTAYLVFHVGDYDAFLAQRSAKGLTPFDTSSDDYGRFAKFRDPEGNEVDVWGAKK